jgi:hypothetical protein
LDPTIWREYHILQSYFTENSYSSIKADMDPFENQLVLIILYVKQKNIGIGGNDGFNGIKNHAG